MRACVRAGGRAGVCLYVIMRAFVRGACVRVRFGICDYACVCVREWARICIHSYLQERVITTIICAWVSMNINTGPGINTEQCSAVWSTCYSFTHMQAVWVITVAAYLT